MYEAPAVVLSAPLLVLTSVQPVEIAPEIRTINIRLILLEAFEECNMTPANNRYDSTVWHTVFCKVFNRAPSSSHDPLWDALFAHDGFKALTVVCTL